MKATLHGEYFFSFHLAINEFALMKLNRRNREVWNWIIIDGNWILDLLHKLIAEARTEYHANLWRFDPFLL